MRSIGNVAIAAGLIAGILAATNDRARAQPTTLGTLLARAGLHVRQLRRASEGIVADERLAIDVRATRNAGPVDVQRQVAMSDVTLVWAPDIRRLVLVRQVHDLDGTVVLPERTRLTDALADSGPTRLFRFETILLLSAQRLPGSADRDQVQPTAGLDVLDPDRQSAFSFTLRGEERLDGALVRRLDFTERARPTLLQDEAGGDVALTGSLWIEPSTGIVRRTTVRTSRAIDRGQTRQTSTATMNFRYADTLEAWVPADLNAGHVRTQPNHTLDIRDVATYSGFHRVVAAAK